MKEVTVFVTNRTPITVTIQGRVIAARAIAQPIQVFNVDRFCHEVEAAYPDGQIVVSFEQAKDQEATQQTSTSDAPAELASLGLSSNVEKALVKHGVKTVQQLTEMTAQNVIDVKGIADAGLQEIAKQLEANGLTLKEANDGE
ncbi:MULTISPECIES: DNA-directed RNA polymerase subunit alpha C-terminal domain-containing protein [unclassified Vibrio]|uniref:DNA-directed RNA polymerase subunit alpha C-terminal domain-containing protein n=1 Tax=Vibrio TaxID=662 RepID=UPI001268ED76|nr:MULTISPECIES: DNA-directed RNA polymerase subunit alpha C-terminal domain-containing protein [unclassified Vibrio]QFT40109.1 DNA-directed RNA polymerase subunit alpha [Vibrio sp. THAF64]QGM37932.1 DNA-directed RNA polymerase subunit alpha [Vibrio sp. THAF191d]QGN73487.1 DNA-directed RNA polymerase subunit alpha [Vibrio sp. THAF191c]